MTVPPTFTADEFRAARKRLGMTQPTFARLIGMRGENARRQVRRIEDGQQLCPHYAATILHLVLKFPCVRRELGVDIRDPV